MAITTSVFAVKAFASNNRELDLAETDRRTKTFQLGTNIATPTFGQLPKFHYEWERKTAYVERGNLFLSANDISEKTRFL